MLSYCSIHTTWYNEHLLPHDEHKNYVLGKTEKEGACKFAKQSKKKPISTFK
jgi:hypothetical protein